MQPLRSLGSVIPLGPALLLFGKGPDQRREGSWGHAALQQQKQRPSSLLKAAKPTVAAVERLPACFYVVLATDIFSFFLFSEILLLECSQEERWRGIRREGEK